MLASPQAGVGPGFVQTRFVGLAKTPTGKNKYRKGMLRLVGSFLKRQPGD